MYGIRGQVLREWSIVAHVQCEFGGGHEHGRVPGNLNPNSYFLDSQIPKP